MLTEQDYIDAAQILSCETAVIKAVKEVESGGSGFLKTGECKMLFEPHIFWKELRKRGIDPNQHTAGNEDILYVKWVTGKYGTVNQQPGRLARAVVINEDAALCSASYGLFQVLGGNFAACGYSTVKDFYSDMCKDEAHQLNAFCQFVKNNHLDDELREHLWTQFARAYNGAGFAKNRYHVKLEAAYNKYK